MKNEIRFFIEDHPKVVRIVTIALIAIVILVVALMSRSCSSTEQEDDVKIVFDSGETEVQTENESEQLSFLEKANNVFENRKYSEEEPSSPSDETPLIVFDDQTLPDEERMTEGVINESVTIVETQGSQVEVQGLKPTLIDRIKNMTLRSFFEYVNAPEIERKIVIMIFLAVFIYAFLIDIVYIMLSGFKVGLKQVESGMKKIERKKAEQVDEPVLDLDQDVLSEKKSQYMEINDDDDY